MKVLAAQLTANVWRNRLAFRVKPKYISLVFGTVPGLFGHAHSRKSGANQSIPPSFLRRRTPLRSLGVLRAAGDISSGRQQAFPSRAFLPKQFANRKNSVAALAKTWVWASHDQA